MISQKMSASQDDNEKNNNLYLLQNYRQSLLK